MSDNEPHQAQSDRPDHAGPATNASRPEARRIFRVVVRMLPEHPISVGFRRHASPTVDQGARGGAGALIVRVGHAAIAPAYTVFFCITLWFAAETLRRKLLPLPNAWMVTLAAACWFATEITGEIYNLGLGTISEVMFRIVWVFYGTNVILWALSGYRWEASGQS